MEAWKKNKGKPIVAHVIAMKRYVMLGVPIILSVIILYAIHISKIPAAGNHGKKLNSSQIDYKGEMRKLVEEIALHARQIDPDFIVVPQGGVELLTLNGEANGPVAESYLNIINGIGQEGLFYGYDVMDKPTSIRARTYLLQFLKLAQKHGKKVLIIDYCKTPEHIINSYTQNSMLGFISYAASDIELNQIPEGDPINCNNKGINSLKDVKNFLCLLNPEKYSNKIQFITALKATNYDLIIIDAFFNEELLKKTDVEQLKIKANGGRRLVLAYLSIGEAEDHRYYWEKQWKANPPSWIMEENPKWPGNYKVCYWSDEWKEILYKGENSYLDKILDSNFDGVYLDVVDAYTYFELNSWNFNQIPLTSSNTIGIVDLKSNFHPLAKFILSCLKP